MPCPAKELGGIRAICQSDVGCSVELISVLPVVLLRDTGRTRCVDGTDFHVAHSGTACRAPTAERAKKEEQTRERGKH
jgi:hypothetical protein